MITNELLSQLYSKNYKGSETDLQSDARLNFPFETVENTFAVSTSFDRV